MQKIVPELIGKKIAEERKKRGLLQRELAELTYLDVSVVNRMEKHGESVGHLEKAYSCCQRVKYRCKSVSKFRYRECLVTKYGVDIRMSL